MRRGQTRRQFLAAAGKAGLAAGLISRLTPGGTRAANAAAVFAPSERATLDAALARIIPADGPGDWSAADIGAGDYIERLLSGDGRIYAGGPGRAGFANFRPLTRTKEMGWADETVRLRRVYTDGLAELNRRAGGNFAARPPAVQDAILTSIDLEGSDFFRALFDHTMEGVYGHPVYGGNRGQRAWKDLCYQGDVHGVRYPGIGDPGESWNVHGGYAPSEIAQPGTCPGQGPVE